MSIQLKKIIQTFIIILIVISIFSVCAQTENEELQEVTFRESVPLKYPEHIGLLTSCSPEGKKNVMTIGWYMIAGSNPPKFAIGVRKTHYTHELISKTLEFVLAYPTEDMKDEVLFCGTRTGRKVDKFKETGLTPIKGKSVKAPLIKECRANFECQVIDTMDGGTHTIFLGKILHSWINPKMKDKKRLYNLGKRIFKGLP
jgi:flavin reductase (DIM6/NTAB) family NADH-FMN oxidoreductase RutF